MILDREAELRAVLNFYGRIEGNGAEECLNAIAQMRQEIAKLNCELAVKDRAIRENLQSHIEHNEAVRIKFETELFAVCTLLGRRDDAIRYVLRFGLDDAAYQLLREAIGDA